MKALFCGSRDWDDDFPIKVIIDGLDSVVFPENVVVINGQARGADRVAHKTAVDLGVAVDPYPAEWDKHGKKAGPIRNQQMLDEGEPDVVFAFHDDLEGSKGTRDMVQRAREAGVPVYVIGRYQ